MGLRISFFFFYTFDGRDLPKLHFHYMHPDFTVDFFYLKLKLKTWWNWWDTVYWRVRHTNVSNLTISNQPSLIVDGSPAATAGMFYWVTFYFWESLKYGKQIMSGRNKTLWMDPKQIQKGWAVKRPEDTQAFGQIWSLSMIMICFASCSVSRLQHGADTDSHKILWYVRWIWVTDTECELQTLFL